VLLVLLYLLIHLTITTKAAKLIEILNKNMLENRILFIKYKNKPLNISHIAKLTIKAKPLTKVIRRADTFGLYIDITNNSTSFAILIKEIKLTTPNGFVKLDDESLEKMNSEYKTTQQSEEETNSRSKGLRIARILAEAIFVGLFSPICLLIKTLLERRKELWRDRLEFKY
jgi:hypothetical protein